MNEKIKETFDKIHAEEELKNKTKEFIVHKMKEHKKSFSYKRLIPVMAGFLFILIAVIGYHLYFTPVTTISIDVNPSIELGINRFDKVVSVKGYNQDGKDLVSELNIQFENYTEALKEILSNESFAGLLSQGEELSIAVIDSDETRSAAVLSNIQSFTTGQKNAYCYSANPKEVEEAHEAGLSYGKYRAYLELQALDPSVTAEEVQGMTMKQIRSLIEELSSAEGQSGSPVDSESPANSEAPVDSDTETGHKGGGKGNGWGRRNRHRG